MKEPKLSLTDMRILKELEKNDCTLGLLATTLQVNKDYVWQRLRLLELRGCVKKLDRGFYTYLRASKGRPED